MKLVSDVMPLNLYQFLLELKEDLNIEIPENFIKKWTFIYWIKYSPEFEKFVGELKKVVDELKPKDEGEDGSTLKDRIDGKKGERELDIWWQEQILPKLWNCL